VNGLTCDHCGAETSNGLALCETCQAGVRVYLEFVPVYFRNLARWKPGRAGSRPVPGSRVPPGFMLEARTGNSDRIGRALDEVGADLAGWAECLADDRGVLAPDAADEPGQAASVCATMTEHLTSISTTAWCGEFVSAMARNEKRLRELTEDYVPGWYAGGCRQCGYGTYVVPGLTWVTCSNVDCGVTTYARDHLATILEEARGWVARPMRLAEACVALLDTEQSVPRLHKRIAKWGERERIVTIRDSDYAPKRHRLGDVLDLLANEGATRLDVIRAPKAS
jgi:hypothetical protein